jgi:hypothetical protein
MVYRENQDLKPHKRQVIPVLLDRVVSSQYDKASERVDEAAKWLPLGG